MFSKSLVTYHSTFQDRPRKKAKKDRAKPISDQVEKDTFIDWQSGASESDIRWAHAVFEGIQGYHAKNLAAHIAQSLVKLEYAKPNMYG